MAHGDIRPAPTEGKNQPGNCGTGGAHQVIPEQENTLHNDLLKTEELDRTYKEKLTFLQAERDKVNEELSLCREELGGIQVTFDQRKEGREKLEASLDQARKRLVELETRQVQLKAHQRELQNRINNFNESRTNLLKGIDDSKEAIKASQTNRDKVRTEQETLKEKSEANEAELRKVTEKLSSLGDQEKKVSQEISRFETDHARANAHWKCSTRRNAPLPAGGWREKLVIRGIKR